MALGRTWQESFNKALRSLETGLSGWGLNPKDGAMLSDVAAIKEALRVPNPDVWIRHFAFIFHFALFCTQPLIIMTVQS